ncbi:sulfatase [Methylolobus aquaticus]|nr:sulfatase [Methylolobus aquaticus]
MRVPRFPAKWLCLIGCVHLSSVPAAPRPNILWITIEDTSPHFIGAYGNSQAHTPNIDRLAREGVQFTSAFSTGTVCAPSRSTLITGVRTYQLGTGHHRSTYRIPSKIRGFPYYLRNAGYYTSNNAKTDYNLANEAALVRDAWNASSKNAGWWGRQPGQPFFAVFNYLESHQLMTMVEPYDQYVNHVVAQLGSGEVVDDQAVEMPPFYRDSAEMRRSFARIYNALSLTDKRIGELLDRLRADNLLDSTIIFFFGDHGEGMPRGKTNGVGLGYRVPFVVWFPPAYEALSPWGKAVVTNELITFEDLVPTVLSLAGVMRPSHLKGRVFLGPDRTAAKDVIFLSSDRADNSMDQVRSASDGRYLYSRNFMSFIPELRRIEYTDESEIVQWIRSDYAQGLLDPVQSAPLRSRPAEFLFDLWSDPWEVKNLVGNSTYSPVLSKLRNAVVNNLTASRDILLLPEYELGLINRFAVPHNYRQDNAKFPVSTIAAAANLSGKRSRSVTQRQIDLLKSGNKIVRYWAAMGLRAQSRGDLLPFRSQLSAAQSDSYPPVAILAAAIDYHHFGTASARDVLIGFLLNGNADLVLLTLNLLMYSARPEPFIGTVQDLTIHWADVYAVRAACQVFLRKVGMTSDALEAALTVSPWP